MTHGMKVLTLSVSLFAALLVGCAQEESPASLAGLVSPAAAEAGDATVGPGPPSGSCTQARAEPLPARLAAIVVDGGAPAMEMGTVYTVKDLYNQFANICGGCHVQTNLGNFQILGAGDFTKAMTTSDALARVTSESACGDQPQPMPPCGNGGKPYSQRSHSDPIYFFAELVKAWLALKAPGTFTATVDTGEAANSSAGATLNAVATYALSPRLGDEMTNLGSCIPSPGIVGYETGKSAALDKLFAGAVADADPNAPGEKRLGLPLHLKDTDLFTLDSKTLAAYGVVAYAPGYPLWSDDAGKLRYVRVPRGQSIRFDKATQTFEIPPNTRFYKTFLKQVADVDGSLRWRKVETRLIVSRPNTFLPDGITNETHALFGSYKWTDDEQDAILGTQALHDGTGFQDDTFSYTRDEQLQAAILETPQVDPEQTLLKAQARRNYAIPSSERCIDCHRGSASQSFVLGFLPLQIKRRPAGEGGVIEPTGPDELTQLERLIDYGVITGVDFLGDVLPLEQSQGSRTYRNDFELKAQGYMLGNCSHCHNPNGTPSQQNTILRDVLDFLPGPGPVGGIFQFPLEKASPRILRGLNGDTPIPYITPSLVDLPVVLSNDPKVFNVDPFFIGAQQEADGNIHVQGAFYAPWRSLIYRNVDNPFPYTYDHVFYPHMPMHTPGYDPRAKQILSDWMVSIPAVRKHPERREYAFQGNSASVQVPDDSPQPYVEVMPGQPGYEDAVKAANQRLAILHGADNPDVIDDEHLAIVRYSDPGETEDIYDPDVQNVLCSVPASASRRCGGPGCYYPISTANIPGHPNWVTSDLTTPPGPWTPRRSDWQANLIQSADARSAAAADGGACSNAGGAVARDAAAVAVASSCQSMDTGLATDRTTAVGLLTNVHLDDGFKTFATTAVPFGLWAKKCDQYPGQKTVAEVEHQHWMDVATGIAPQDPVYMETPGAAIFNSICINCHGPHGDGTGRMAQNLLTLTGGLTRVADLRDGLFGPVTSPGGHFNTEFAATNLTADSKQSCSVGDWQGTAEENAARYMAWMGLGGTAVNIPQAILDVVGTTRVFGIPRTSTGGTPSANMLSLAKGLCEEVLGLQSDIPADSNPEFPSSVVNPKSPGGGYLEVKGLFRSLIRTNGDAELWLKLCAMDNPPPVHPLILQYAADRGFSAKVQATDTPDVGGIQVLIGADDYRSGILVGNDRGTTDVTSPNYWPWCIDGGNSLLDATSPITQDQLDAAVRAGIPMCPQVRRWTHSDVETWTIRGAINAGLAVFLYLEQLEGHDPQPAFDACDQLTK